MMDAMNVDWCLTCNKQTSNGKPYCSKSCKLRARECADAYAGEFSYTSDDASCSSDALRESSSRLHQFRQCSTSQRRTPTHSSSSQRAMSRRTTSHRQYAPQQHQYVEAELAALACWPGYNHAGIDAWRNAIPPGSNCVDGPSIAPGTSYTHTRPQFRLSRQRPAGPALCTDTTQPARTSLRSSSPISLPSPRASDTHAQPSYSVSKYSLVSALTESVGTPESTRGHTKMQVRVEVGNVKPGVFEGIARRFRAWGASSAAPAKLKHDAPAEIFMETTTATFPASLSPSPSPLSPVIHRSSTTKSNAKSNASGFTIRADVDDGVEDKTFDLRVPLANARSPLTIRDFELKDTLPELPKRGVWIAGREKYETGWAGFGPAHYEKGFRDGRPADVDERADRELREFEAWNARGRKAVRG